MGQYSHWSDILNYSNYYSKSNWDPLLLFFVLQTITSTPKISSSSRYFSEIIANFSWWAHQVKMFVPRLLKDFWKRQQKEVRQCNKFRMYAELHERLWAIGVNDLLRDVSALPSSIFFRVAVVSIWFLKDSFNIKNYPDERVIIHRDRGFLTQQVLSLGKRSHFFFRNQLIS